MLLLLVLPEEEAQPVELALGDLPELAQAEEEKEPDTVTLREDEALPAGVLESTKLMVPVGLPSRMLLTEGLEVLEGLSCGPGRDPVMVAEAEGEPVLEPATEAVLVSLPLAVEEPESVLLQV